MSPPASDHQQPPLLAVQGIAKRFGQVQALCDVAFTLRDGEILGLIGPNGAGKTTLLECIAGLLPTDRGEVYYLGNRLPPRKRRAALFLVPEGVTPYAEHQARHVLAFIADVYRRPHDARREIVDSLSLLSVMKRRVGELSKGERRRLSLAIALLTPHAVLLMDEPFDGLDLRQTREAMAALRACAARGRTLLLSIHQLVDAERACDRFVLLSHGRVAGQGTLAELRERAGGSGSLEDVFLALS